MVGSVAPKAGGAEDKNLTQEFGGSAIVLYLV